MRASPVSSPSSIYITVIPVSRSPAAIAAWIGAAPRQRGKSDACKFKDATRGMSSTSAREDLPERHDDDDIRLERSNCIDAIVDP